MLVGSHRVGWGQTVLLPLLEWGGAWFPLLSAAGLRVGLYFFMANFSTWPSPCAALGVCGRQPQHGHVFRAWSPPVCQAGSQPGPPARAGKFNYSQGSVKKKKKERKGQCVLSPVLEKSLSAASKSAELACVCLHTWVSMEKLMCRGGRPCGFGRASSRVKHRHWLHPALHLAWGLCALPVPPHPHLPPLRSDIKAVLRRNTAPVQFKTATDIQGQCIR